MTRRFFAFFSLLLLLAGSVIAAFATLNVFAPSSASVEDPVIVRAVYNIDGFRACGSVCNVNGGWIGSDIRMTEEGCEYYLRTKAPSTPNFYTLSVTCSKNGNNTLSRSFSVNVIRSPATLTATVPSVVFGEEADVQAYYNSFGRSIEGASCNAVLKDGARIIEEKSMSYAGSRYTAKLRIPLSQGSYSVNINCTHVKYDSAVYTQFVSASKRSSHMQLLEPSKPSFYPTDEIKVKARYTDSISGTTPKGAFCTANVGGAAYTLRQSGDAFEAALQIGVGDYTATVECSGDVNEKSNAIYRFSVKQIPVSLKVLELKSEYRTNDKIDVKIQINDIFERPAQITCYALAETYDTVLSKIESTKNYKLTRNIDVHTFTIDDTAQPSKLKLTVTCTDPIYEAATVRLETTVKLLGKETAEGLTLYLGISSVGLLIVIILIRRKFNM